MLKLKLGILGILGICGSLKLVRSYSESLMALTRELTWSCWFSKRVSSPNDDARLSVWYKRLSSEVLWRRSFVP